MNKSYVSVWNEALGSWVAASENTAARGKRSKAKVVKAIAAASLFAAAQAGHASVVASGDIPTGGAACPPSGTPFTWLGTSYTSQSVVDGSGYISMVGGCSANGNNNTGVTLYGAFTTVTGDGGTALGFGSSAAEYGTGVGVLANASGTSSSALGFNALASGASSVALGTAATATADNSVALGAGSTTTANLATPGYNPGSKALAGIASAANGEVSVGSSMNQRRLTNVASGSAMTDAVNVSQLQSEAAKSNTLGAATAAALGGGSTYSDLTGAISAPSYSVGGTTVHSVGDAVTNLDDRVTENTTDITKIQNQLGDVGTQLSGAVQYDRNADGSVNFNSVTLGGGQSAGPVVLTNVANGTSQYDAVNFGQLSALQDQVTDLNGQVSNLTGQMENVQPGSPTTDIPSASSGDGAEINAAMPGTGVGSTAAGAGAAASGNYATAIGANASAVADNAVAVGASAAATGVNSTAIGTGSQAANTNSVALGQGSVTDRDNSVSVGSAGNERQITNVAAGTAPTDAVNVGQLNSVRSDMNDLRKDAMGGVASAMALANLPQSVLPGRTMVAMGASTYGGQVGTALGMSYMTRDSKWTVKGAATTSTRGEIGGALSAGFYF